MKVRFWIASAVKSSDIAGTSINRVHLSPFLACSCSRAPPDLPKIISDEH